MAVAPGGASEVDALPKEQLEEELCSSCNFCRTKALNIAAVTREVVGSLRGRVPEAYNELLKLQVGPDWDQLPTCYTPSGCAARVPTGTLPPPPAQDQHRPRTCPPRMTLPLCFERRVNISQGVGPKIAHLMRSVAFGRGDSGVVVAAVLHVALIL